MDLKLCAHSQETPCINNSCLCDYDYSEPSVHPCLKTLTLLKEKVNEKFGEGCRGWQTYHTGGKTGGSGGVLCIFLESMERKMSNLLKLQLCTATPVKPSFPNTKGQQINWPKKLIKGTIKTLFSFQLGMRQIVNKKLVTSKNREYLPDSGWDGQSFWLSAYKSPSIQIVFCEIWVKISLCNGNHLNDMLFNSF